MNDESFDKAIEGVLRREGGFVNHPLDPGGATNYGITIGTLSSYLNRNASVKEVQELSVETAKKIYKLNYWDENRIGEIESTDLAGLFLDQSVNRGTRTAAKNLQSVCNGFKGTNLVVDGVIGPKTLARINDELESQTERIFLEYLFDAQKNYVLICKKSPDKIAFLLGWLNRTHDVVRDIVYN